MNSELENIKKRIYHIGEVLLGDELWEHNKKCIDKDIEQLFSREFALMFENILPEEIQHGGIYRCFTC